MSDASGNRAPVRRLAISATLVSLFAFGTLAACNEIAGIGAPSLESVDASLGADGSLSTQDATVLDGGATSETGSGEDAAPSSDSPSALPDSSSGKPDASPPFEAGCPAGDLTCDGGCVPNGPENCGTCGHDCTALPEVTGPVACGAGGICEFDAGACASGYAHCKGGPDQGCETPVDTATNCGTCGVACSGATPDCSGSGSTYSCASGCTAGLTLCGSTCVDTSNNGSNCKTCGNACSTTVGHATANCVSSACGYTCNSGYTPCNNGCADYATDNSNCGSCGNVCAPGTTCSSGACVCNTGTGCNGCCSNGVTCTAFGNQSSTSCGFSGQACGGCAVTGEVCASISTGGQCQCPSGEAACGGACVNTGTDSSNCGGCGKICSSTLSGSSCGGGQCVCPAGQTACGTTCVDVNGSDGGNCGACGHSCLNGVCSAGVCQPTVLAPTVSDGVACDSIGGLTTDGTTVYWSADCAKASVVLGCTGTGCGTSPTLINTGPFGFQILVSGGTLFWEVPGSLKTTGGLSFIASCPPSNCTTPTNLGSMVTGGIATNGTNLYWWNGTSTLDTCAISGCTTASQVNTYSSSQPSATGAAYTVAANATSVFWAASATGTILSCIASNGLCAGTIAISTGRVGATVIAADASNVYWNETAGVMQCPVGGCAGAAPTVLGAANATNIASDGTYVYWPSGTTIYRAQIGHAGSAVAIAQNQAGAGTVAVGPKAVYWSVNTGNIMLLAK